jgi:hypothetical protein
MALCIKRRRFRFPRNFLSSLDLAPSKINVHELQQSIKFLKQPILWVIIPKFICHGSRIAGQASHGARRHPLDRAPANLFSALHDLRDGKTHSSCGLMEFTSVKIMTKRRDFKSN